MGSRSAAGPKSQRPRAKRASGVTGAAYQKLVVETDIFRARYANPPLRLLMSFAQVFPIGLLVAVAGAALLRNPRFLPARPKPAESSLAPRSRR